MIQGQKVIMEMFKDLACSYDNQAYQRTWSDSTQESNRTELYNTDLF